MDADFPRAVHYCISRASESLHAITGTPSSMFRYTSEQLMGQLQAELDYTSVQSVIRRGLHEYLDGLQAKMNAIDQSLRDDFAVTVPQITTQTSTESNSQSQSQSSKQSSV